MLSRLFSRSLSQPFKTLTLIPSSSSSSSSSSSISSLFSSNPITPHPSFLLHFLRSFSSKGNGDGDGDGSWTFSPEPDTAISSVFGEGEGTLAGIAEEGEAPNEGGRSELKPADPWAEEEKGDIFEGIDKEMLPKVGGGDEEWETAEGYEPWSLGGGDDGDGEKGDVFGIEDEGIEGIKGIEGIDGGQEKSEEMMELERKEQELLATLKEMAVPTVTPASQRTPQVLLAQVGAAFVQQYYHVLHKTPEMVHKFYQDCSILSRPDSGGERSQVTTLKASPISIGGRPSVIQEKRNSHTRQLLTGLLSVVAVGEGGTHQEGVGFETTTSEVVVGATTTTVGATTTTEVVVGAMEVTVRVMQ